MMTGRRLLTLLWVTSVLLGFSTALQATVIVFDDKGDFLAETGAFGNGPYPDAGNVGQGSHTIGVITFTGNLTLQRRISSSE